MHLADDGSLVFAFCVFCVGHRFLADVLDLCFLIVAQSDIGHLAVAGFSAMAVLLELFELLGRQDFCDLLVSRFHNRFALFGLRIFHLGAGVFMYGGHLFFLLVGQAQIGSPAASAVFALVHLFELGQLLFGEDRVDIFTHLLEQLPFLFGLCVFELGHRGFADFLDFGFLVFGKSDIRHLSRPAGSASHAFGAFGAAFAAFAFFGFFGLQCSGQYDQCKTGSQCGDPMSLHLQFS